jgi:DNA-binding NtrC family response regulator/predicted hydrocarbon binding protein
MKPTRLSAQVFNELPPVLSHYLEQDRNVWLESIPRAGKVFLRNQPGIFTELHDLAVESRLLVQNVGEEWAHAIRYRNGFELGRLDAARQYAEFNGNPRLALQAATVFRQLQGWYVAQTERFEFDLNARTLYREVILKESIEAAARRLWAQDEDECACWGTAGYLSGHIVGIVGGRVLTIEVECIAKGDKRCRFISKFDAEWGEDAAWTRQVLSTGTVLEELATRDDAVAVAKKAEQRARVALNDLNRRLRSDLMVESLVGESAGMQPVLRRARQVMSSDVPVLEIGEPGSGRETLARAIHNGSARQNKPFVMVDCLGLKGDLLTQELFGYAKDAFPGTTRSYTGACARAHGGTLYLNEAANLTLEAQVLLLRAMREGVVFPLGAESPVKAEIRVVAATQHHLAAKLSSGEFLEHLYYALNVAAIDIPPLRERDSDILRLAETFLREFCEHYNRPDLKFSQDLKQALLDCAWPGNVRQLRGVIEHAVIMAEGDMLGIEALPEDVLATRWRRPQQELTEEVVRAALRRARGNRGEAADLLGIGRTSLWRAMKRLGI